jgi:hypothetical protein
MGERERETEAAGRRWCILRTSGRHTISLAETLAKDGWEVWTPIETRTIRAGPSRRRVDVRQPIMPSYVFAREDQLLDLIELAAARVKARRGAGLADRDRAHADFSVLHAFGRIPLVSDRHLAALRLLEAKRTPIKRAAFAFPKNASARVTAGVCQGLVGVVVRSTPKSTVIRFTGAFPFEIPTSFLTMEEVHQANTAALKAA